MVSHEPLKIAVIGLGRIGWKYHCRVLGDHGDFQLAAMVDAVAERRAEAQSVYRCPAYATMGRMFKHHALDAVVIATPTHLHARHAREALSQGCHLMLEKPAAPTFGQAQAIDEAARQHNRIVTVYQPHRAKAWFVKARQLIAQEFIGDVYHVRFGLFSYVQRNDWQSLRKFVGGMLSNYGAHALDLLLDITGRNVAKLLCNLRRVASLGDAEDVVKIVYETRQGMIGEVDINQACTTTPYEFEAYGTRGVMTRCDNALHVRRIAAGLLPAKSLDASLASASRAYPRDELQFEDEQFPDDPSLAVDVYHDFAQAIRTGTQPLVPYEQTLSLMRVLQRCRRQAGGICQTPVMV